MTPRNLVEIKTKHTRNMESIRKNAKKARSRRGPNAACHGWRLVYMLHCVTPVGARCASPCESYSFRKMTYHVRDTAAHVCRRQTTKGSKSIDAYVVACLSFSLWSLNPGRDSRDYCTLYSESSTSGHQIPGETPGTTADCTTSLPLCT